MARVSQIRGESVGISVVPCLNPFSYPLSSNRQDGLGDAGLPDAAEARHVETEHAALAMIRLCKQYPSEVTLVAVGPLTNVALACKLDEGFAGSVKEMVIMGGTTRAKGNVSLTGEFNFHKGEKLSLFRPYLQGAGKRRQ